MIYFKKILYLTLPIVIIVNVIAYIYALEIGNFLLWVSIIGFAILLLCDYTIDNSTNKENNKSDLLDDEEIFLDTQKINPIKNIINAHQNLKFFSMALIGAWGSGKSSYLKTLQEDIKQEHHVIYLNVWELEDSSNVISEVKKEFDNIIFNINYKLWLFNTLLNIFYKDYFGLLSKYFIKSDIKLPSFFEQTLKESKENYNKLLIKLLNDKKIIIMIDEVDRLHEKQEILNIFKVIRYTASFDNVFVLTALDFKQINKKLEDDIEYIHKIFNIKYAIPNADKNEFIKYYKETIFPKFDFCITKKEIERLFTTKHQKTEKSILDIVSTYRVIKNSFNDTYVFTKALEDARPNEWQSYIPFGYIYIINIIKAISFKDYSYLIVNAYLSTILDLLKNNKQDELQKNNLEKSTIELLYFLIEPPYEYRIENLLAIYKAYKIYDYHISSKQYEQFVQDVKLIEKALNALEVREYKTAFLSHLISIIYEDKENQYVLLKKTIELIIANKEEIEYRELLENTVIRSINVATLVNKENQKLFLPLFKDKELGNEFISLVFDNQKLMFFGKQIEQDVVLYLFKEYLKSIDCKNSDEKELEEKLKELLLRNLTLANIDHYEKENLNDEEKQELQFSNNIRKIIIDNCLKYKKDVVTKFLIASMPFENVKNFFEENNLQIKELLDDQIRYEVKLSNNDGSYSHNYFSKKEIEDKLK